MNIDENVLSSTTSLSRHYLVMDLLWNDWNAVAFKIREFKRSELISLGKILSKQVDRLRSFGSGTSFYFDL